jgi:hypothetical protein
MCARGVTPLWTGGVRTTWHGQPLLLFPNVIRMLLAQIEEADAQTIGAPPGCPCPAALPGTDGW